MKDEFKNFIEGSKLPKEDKEMWSTLINVLKPENIAELAGLINNDNEQLAMLTRNIREKKLAIALNDSAMMESIIKGEENELTDPTKT